MKVDRHFTDSCFPLANNGKVKNEPMQSCNIVERKVTKECEKRMATKRGTITDTDTENPSKISIDLIYFS